MMTERVVSEARSDALKWQAQASSRPAEPLDPEQADRDRARALGSPGADVAAALLAVTGWAPIPLGDDLRPSGAPLTTYGDVHAHYRNRHGDGTGLALGVYPGAVLVAVHGTATAWRAWTADVAVERSRGRYEDGSAPLAAGRDLGRFVSVSWQPHGSQGRSTGVAVGTSALNVQAESMRPRHVGAGERGWVVWALSASDPAVRFAARRKLAHGLEVLGEGIVPLHAVRRDGWRAVDSGLPSVEPMPGWLTAELGGRLGSRARR